MYMIVYNDASRATELEQCAVGLRVDLGNEKGKIEAYQDLNNPGNIF